MSRIVGTVLYDSLDVVPEAEQEDAEQARRLSDQATAAMRANPSYLPALSRAIDQHQRRTGWRYLPPGHYRKRITE